MTVVKQNFCYFLDLCYLCIDITENYEFHENFDENFRKFQ